MAKVIEKSAKTVEDALKAALEELGVSEDKVDYEVLEEASRGFLGIGIIGAKLAKIRVTVKEDASSEKIVTTEPEKKLTKNVVEDKIFKEKATKMIKQTKIYDDEKIKIAKKFLQDILTNMKIDVNIEDIPSEDVYTFNICGENLGILIGKHGQTLDALQYLVNIVANRNEKNRIRFIIDVENYRTHRAEILKNLAKNLADRAIKMNQEVRLEPMNRHERRVIHTSLQNNEEVTTCSRGEEPYRYIVISPKNQDISKK